MHSNVLMLSFLVMVSFILVKCEYICFNDGMAWCGMNCTGTPKCNGKTCGNKANMCYCDCYWNGLGYSYKCRTSELGYKWNGGIKDANGNFALNGTKGDGKEYDC